MDLEPARARLAVLKTDSCRVRDESKSTVLALARAGIDQGGSLVRDVLAGLEEQAGEPRGAIAEREGAIQALDCRHVDLEVVRRALSDFDSCFDLLADDEKQEFLRLMVRQVVVHPAEVEVYEGQSFSARVEGLQGTRGGKNARVNTDEVNTADAAETAPEPRPGTKPGSEDPGFRARCVLAPRTGLEPVTSRLTVGCSTN